MTDGNTTSGSAVSSDAGTILSEFTASAEDRAFIDSYESAADEYDEKAKQTEAGPKPTAPTSTLSDEDQGAVNSYAPSAGEIDPQAAWKAAVQPQQQQEQPAAQQQETLESLRAQLEYHKNQQAMAHARPALVMPGPGGAAVHRETEQANTAAIKATQEKIFRLEKEERRNAFMERQRDIAHEQEAEMSPDPVEG